MQRSCQLSAHLVQIWYCAYMISKPNKQMLFVSGKKILHENCDCHILQTIDKHNLKKILFFLFQLYKLLIITGKDCTIDGLFECGLTDWCITLQTIGCECRWLLGWQLQLMFAESRSLGTFSPCLIGCITIFIKNNSSLFLTAYAKLTHFQSLSKVLYST